MHPKRHFSSCYWSIKEPTLWRIKKLSKVTSIQQVKCQVWMFSCTRAYISSSVCHRVCFTNVLLLWRDCSNLQISRLLNKVRDHDALPPPPSCYLPDSADSLKMMSPEQDRSTSIGRDVLSRFCTWEEVETSVVHLYVRATIQHVCTL